MQSEISLMSTQMCLPARNDLMNEIKFLKLIFPTCGRDQ